MNFKKLKTGALITIEGIDGCGKSSLAKFLNESLTKFGYSVKLTKEPGATELGKKLRLLLEERKYTLLDKTEYLLFAADRAQHFNDVVKPAIDSECIVICDRMADSSLAYQGFGRNVDKEMIKIINSWTMNDFVPDLTLYLRIDYQTAFSRIKRRSNDLSHFEKEKSEFFMRVIDGYEKIFSTKKNVVYIDASKEIEHVSNEAIKTVLNFIEANK